MLQLLQHAMQVVILFLRWAFVTDKSNAKICYQGQLLKCPSLDTQTKKYSSLAFCEQHDIELLYLRPHTTHVLQSLDRTVFNTLKTYFHSEATKYIHNQPSGRISKFNFGELFTKAWHRTAIPAHAEKGFECTGIFPYNPDVIPEEKFLPSTVFSPQEKPSVPVSGGFASTPTKLDFCQTTSKPQKNIRAGNVHSLPSEVQYESSSAEDGPCEVSVNCEDETPCNSCGLRYNSVESIKR
ncbi:hypothetical protein PR048_025084, partial [Dryococelus australis]